MVDLEPMVEEIELAEDQEHDLLALVQVVLRRKAVEQFAVTALEVVGFAEAEPVGLESFEVLLLSMGQLEHLVPVD